MKLKDLLSKIGQSYFYLMHLSYNNKPSREPLWRYASGKNRVGLDYSGMDRKWSEITSRKKRTLNWFWRHQFELFCDKMVVGDCVLVIDGISHLLGIGVVKGPYMFEEIQESEQYPKGFFRHVRPVLWLKKYRYEKRVPFKIPTRFGNTISYVDPSRPRWKLVNREIGNISPSALRMAKNSIKRQESKIYSEGGVKEIQTEISIRDPKLIRDARRRYGTRCKVCGFDFEKKYGKLGTGFIEVHHLKPLYRRKSRIMPTKLKDVTVICSNCHRMIHRKHPPIPLARLKSVLPQRGQ